VGASSQLGLLSAGMILGPGTGKTVWLGWIVLDGDLCYKSKTLGLVNEKNLVLG